MDRRQKRSRDAIFTAFNHLLEMKHFNSITVQEIIDEANVGRSTFYAHFDTKEALLREMCTDIFEHVFAQELHSEKSHDFSEGNHSLKEELTHLLYHLKDNRGNIRGLFAGESGELFLRYFKEYSEQIFLQHKECLQTELPQEYLLNHLSAGFAETVKWWQRRGMKETPEELTCYYLKANHIIL